MSAENDVEDDPQVANCVFDNDDAITSDDESMSSSIECFQLLLRCPICLEQYNDPRMLPCQHSFCLQCLENVSDTRWGRCPVCRRLFRVPFCGGIGALDVNRTIVGLMESCKQQQQKRNCKQSEVHYGRFDKATISSNSNEFSQSNERNSMINARCSECKNERKLKLCVHCRDVLCGECRTNHYNQLSNYLIYKLSEVEETTEHLLNKQESEIDNYNEIVDDCDSVSQKINTKIEAIKQMLDDQQQHLLNQLNEYKHKIKNEITKNTNQIKQISSIRAFCHISKNDLLSKTETDSKVLSIIQQCENHVITTKHLEGPNYIRSTGVGHKETLSKVYFVDKQLDVDDYVIGHLKFNFDNINNHENTQQSTTNKLSRESCIRQYFNRRIPKEDSVRTSRFQFALGIAAVDSGTIYGVDTWTNTIQCWLLRNTSSDDMFVKLWEKNHLQLKNPFGIHVLNNANEKRLVVLDSCPCYPIKIYSTSINLLRAISSPDKDQNGNQHSSSRRKCLIVDLTSNMSKLYVCDAISNCVWQLEYQSLKENWLLFVGKYGSGPGEFCCPISCIASDGLLYVSDWGNRRIQAFDIEDARVKLISNFHSAERPGSLTIVKSTGQLIALCMNDYRAPNKRKGPKKRTSKCGSIVLFKVEGSVMKEAKRKAIQAKQTRRLWGLCVIENLDKSLSVVVSDYGRHKIRLFVNPF
ncbi:hypothetical protein GJ496_000203 [Pomphorhynchus laevis]|nr:hypothetical protein GJ496_000203 [Pomphorhynchus laevis]